MLIFPFLATMLLKEMAVCLKKGLNPFFFFFLDWWCLIFWNHRYVVNLIKIMSPNQINLLINTHFCKKKSWYSLISKPTYEQQVRICLGRKLWVKRTWEVTTSKTWKGKEISLLIPSLGGTFCELGALSWRHGDPLVWHSWSLAHSK